MRLPVSLVPLLLACHGGVALAAEKTIEVVNSASASYSARERHTIIVRATVGLPNSCWSNPHFKAPPSGARPDAQGVEDITIVADSAEHAGLACAMIYRQGIEVPPLHWKHYPATGLKAVRVIGSRTPITAAITRNGSAENEPSRGS